MVNIPGWFDFEDVYRAAVSEAHDGARFVETGTFYGKSAHFMATEIVNSGKTIHFDTWDNWAGVPPSHGYPGWTAGEGPQEEHVRLTLAGLPVHLRTGEAAYASRCYADASLDFVFLDDDHSTAHVRHECDVWWPKVKRGGLFGGHDYDWPSVRAAVTEWAAEAGVTIETVSARCWRVRK